MPARGYLRLDCSIYLSLGCLPGIVSEVQINWNSGERPCGAAALEEFEPDQDTNDYNQHAAGTNCDIAQAEVNFVLQPNDGGD